MKNFKTEFLRCGNLSAADFKLLCCFKCYVKSVIRDLVRLREFVR